MGRPLYFDGLLTTLRSAAKTSSRDFEQNLYYELEQAKPKFFKLFDVPPRSTQEEQAIKKGTAHLHGQSAPSHFNPTFITETLFLAQELDFSELYCAELIDSVAVIDKLGRKATAEKAVARLHDDRAGLLACLRHILEKAMDPSDLSPRVANILSKYAVELMTTPCSLGGTSGQSQLAEKMLLEVDRLKRAIEKTRQSLQRAPTHTSSNSFGHAVLNFRLERIQYERRQLGHLLYLFAVTRELLRAGIVNMVKWLSTADRSDDLVYYMLSAVLAAIDPGPDVLSSRGGGLLQDGALMVDLNSLLSEKTQWRVPELKACINLQFALLMQATRDNDPAISGDKGGVAEDVSKIMYSGIKGDAFQFLTQLIIQSRTATIDSEDVAAGLQLSDGSDSTEKMDPDFRSYFLNQLDNLVTAIILHNSTSSILKRIRTSEDDVESAARMRSSLSLHDAPRRHDTEAFFRLIAAIYAEKEPDAGKKYWDDQEDTDDRLFGFLQWATEVKRTEVIVALYEMLASLARGPLCASGAFNFLATNAGQYHPGQPQPLGAFSWSTLFNALHSTSDNLSRIRTTPMQSTSFGRSAVTPTGFLPPDEVRLLRSFLRLLRHVVYYCIPAREVIRDHQEFKVLSTLFNIVAFPIALELKASLYETLGAFCGMDGSVKAAETMRTMWNLLERSEVIRITGGPGGLAGGAVIELERIETPAKTYPATTALVELLDALVYAPSKASTAQLSTEVDVQTVPENLGIGRRAPGLGPYLDFVIDDVILKAGSRGYNTMTERFRLLDGAFLFLEKCLASYDLTVLRTVDLSPAALNNAAAKGIQSPLTSLVTHPGFDVLCRILTSESPLRRELFMYVSEGFDAIQQNQAQTHFFNRAIRRVLRILYRVMELQGLFIDFLLPLLSHNPTVPGVGPVALPRGVSPLEQYLIWSPELVPQIGMYVNCSDDQEMMLLAIKIISLISESPIFNIVDSSLPGVAKRMNRLVVLLDRHEKTPLIIEGFVALLQMDPDATYIASNDAVADVEALTEDDVEVDRSEALRSAIINLLLRGTAPGRPAPNISHLLLGFPLRVPHAEMTIPDPESMGSSQSCLHTILDLVNVGVPRLEDADMDTSQSVGPSPLFVRNPVLAEQCYKLIHQLSTHDFTCTATVRYLRTREDFFARHLAALSSKVPSIGDGQGGYVQYGDKTRVPSTANAVTSFLRLRASLLECVALELHVLKETKQPQRMARLLELLFDASSHPSYTDSFNVAQPLIRVLEIFESLDFEWIDAINPAPIDLQIYKSTDFDACLDLDENGCQIFSVPLVIGIISAVKRQTQKQGMASSDVHVKRLREETKFVLESCLVENHRRQMDYAKQVSFVAWRHILDISLHECFDRLPRGEREYITLDILQSLPSFLSRAETTPFIATLLAELILSLSTKLREDRHHQLVLQSTINDAFAASLPVDRVHTIFRSIIQCTVRSGMSERFRGNLYAALTNFIHLVTASAESDSPSTAGTASKDLSFMADESTRDSNILALSVQRTSVVKRTALESGTLNIINSFVERLVPTVCRDAADGSEVWKTVAFTFLDALVQLSRLEKAHRVLAVMAREGYLKNFVHSIKSSDRDMMAMLKPDPDNLNPLYVYEAKTALLVRIAQTRQGAERLLDSRIFSLLTHCDFLDARPQNDHAFLDFDSFLPSAIERYHQLLIPALQLAVSVLSAAGHTPVVSKQALDFVLAHRTTILVLLTDQWDELTLGMLRELQLLVALCSFVLPSVGDDDLLVPSGFGAIHSAILSLSARCMSPRRWRDNVVAATEIENMEAQTPARGYGKDPKDSILSEKVDAAAAALQRWLAVYSMNVIEGKREFKPVVAPVMTSTTEGEMSSQIRSTVPTLTDVMTALRSVFTQFVELQNQVHDMGNKLENPDLVSIEEVDEVTKQSYTEFMEELDANQRKVLAVRELGKAWDRGQQQALDRLHWLEVLLLILWRHLDSFLASGSTQQPSNQGLFGNGSLLGRGSSFHSGLNRGGLREQSARELGPVLDELDQISLLPDVIGSDQASRRKHYIDLLSRKLREAVTRDNDPAASQY